MDWRALVDRWKNAPQRLPATDAARRVVESAKKEARRLNQNFVGAEHVLFALVEPHGSAVSKMLVEVGVTAEFVRGELENLREEPSTFFGNLPFTPRAQRIFEQAEFTARKLGSPRVDDVHVLMAMLTEVGGKAKEWFEKVGVPVGGLKERVFGEIVKM
jgi:ATP-dependent Clp protease ATP-binding subunit ClpC